MKIEHIRKRIASRIVFDLHIGLKKTVLLASMGRSGSTFVGNLIDHNNNFRVMFEPFRFDLVKEASHFIYPFYLRPDNNDATLFESARKILLGRVHLPWIDQHNNTIFPKARLIKLIRSNFYLKWLHNRFPEIKIVLLLRHPCAVVNSWLAANFGNGIVARRRLLENDHFIADMDDNLIEEYRKADTDFERLVFLWCFSYMVPFRQFNIDELHLVFYEDIILDPMGEMKRLFRYLGCDYSESGVKEVLSKPSATTRKKASDFDRKVLRIDQWRKQLSQDKIDRTYEIMRLFEMDELYNPLTSMPNRDAAARLFGPKLQEKIATNL